MKKSTIKRLLCATAVAASLVCSGSIVSAGTISFTVTVGGSGTQDPLSRREIKTADGDKYAYFTGKTFSKKSAGIYVRSYNLNNSTIYSGQEFLMDVNAGIVQKAQYKNGYAPGGEYYYMKSEAQTKRVTVTGNYCP